MNDKNEQNISRVDTLAAMVIGYALTYVFNSFEQNAIGNWFMLLGQILETNATFLQMYQSKNQNNTSVRNIDIDDLRRVINIMKEEIDKIKVDK